MAFTAKITQTWQEGTDTPVTQQIDASADSRQGFDIAVPGETTDQEVAMTLDVDQVQAFMMICDQDITIETNSGSAADDTVALEANTPYVWTPDHVDAFIFTVDITALFLTVAGATACTLKIRALVDATP